MHWNTNSSSVNCSLGRSQNKFQRCMEFQIRFTVGPISLSNWCKVYVVSVSLDNAKPLVNSQSLVNVCAVKTNYLVKSSLASYTSVFWASLVSTFYNLNGTLSLTTMTQQSRHADRSRQVIISFFLHCQAFVVFLMIWYNFWWEHEILCPQAIAMQWLELSRLRNLLVSCFWLLNFSHPHSGLSQDGQACHPFFMIAHFILPL